MKIKDLKDAPDWLINANVENEDMDIIDGVVVWHDGTWLGGTWRGGVWRGGKTTAKSRYIPVYENDNLKIGCEVKTFDEWDDWFASDEEYSTKRSDPEFKKIYAHFCAIKAYKKARED